MHLVKKVYIDITKSGSLVHETITALGLRPQRPRHEHGGQMANTLPSLVFQNKN